MGYTHYWKQHKNFTRKEWAKITTQVRALYRYDQGDDLCLEYDEPACPPFIDSQDIRFNGKGDQGLETFYISRVDTTGGTECYCKTGRHDYDLYVTAILTIVEHIAPQAISARSDGDPVDWVDGAFLAAEFCPLATIPAGVFER